MLHKARSRLYHTYLRWDLESAKRANWMGDGKTAARLLFRVMDELIKEPPEDSEEYKHGQEKPEEFEDEPEEEQTPVTDEYDWEYIDPYEDDYGPLGPEPDRDEAGYLIR